MSEPHGEKQKEAQDWFWSERWQHMEREADSDFVAGRFADFDDVEGFLTNLETLTPIDERDSSAL